MLSVIDQFTLAVMQIFSFLLSVIGKTNSLFCCYWGPPLTVEFTDHFVLYLFIFHLPVPTGKTTPVLQYIRDTWSGVIFLSVLQLFPVCWQSVGGTQQILLIQRFLYEFRYKLTWFVQMFLKIKTPVPGKIPHEVKKIAWSFSLKDSNGNTSVEQVFTRISGKADLEKLHTAIVHLKIKSIFKFLSRIFHYFSILKRKLLKYFPCRTVCLFSRFYCTPHRRVPNKQREIIRIQNFSQMVKKCYHYTWIFINMCWRSHSICFIEMKTYLSRIIPHNCFSWKTSAFSSTFAYLGTTSCSRAFLL